MTKTKQTRDYLSSIIKAMMCILIVVITGNTEAQNITRPTVKGPNGFEVNSYTGNLFYRRTDLVVPGRGAAIDLTFSYNSSKMGRNWGMGKGWTFTYNMVYIPDALGMYIERADGRKDFFQKNGTSFTPPTGVFDTLKEYQPNKFYLREKGGTKYFFDNNIHKKLTRMEDRNGNAITLSYTDTLLNTLTDASNRTCTFNWQNGLLKEIIDNSASPVRKLSYNYDAAGNLVKATDPLNYFITYFYDPKNRLIGITDKRGYNTSIVYYATNAVAKIVSCVTTQEFTYIQAQLTTQVIETVSDKKQITAYQYDNLGNIIRKQGNCCGYNLSYQYDANNNISSLKNGLNQETIYEYDNSGNLLKETDALGNSVTYTYEPVFNRPLTIKDKRGNLFTNEYDAKGNLVKTTKPLGISEAYTYAANGDLLSYKDGNGNTTTYEYNANGYVIKTTDNEGGAVIYGYDNSGNQINGKDARNNNTAYQYNPLNSVIKITDALNNVTAYTYDENNNRVSETNALGKKTAFYYDGLNRQISTTTPLGIVTTQLFDEKNNIIKITDGNGNVTKNTYNNRNQLLSSTDGNGNTETYTYDDAGNKTGMTDKNGNGTKYEYDAVSRLIKTTNALNGVMAYGYDGNGNRTTATDANGNNTAYEYDVLNRPVKATDALNKSVIYEYDKNNNRIAETDKNGNKTTYEYDKLNRLKKMTDALTGVTTYNYDGNGNQLFKTDALGNLTNSTYDANNRLLSITDAVADVTAYTYDGVGNMVKTTLSNGNNIVDTYDADNRQTKETDNVGTVVQYSYDNNGNISVETDGLNNTTTYQYDKVNRLVKTKYANNTTQQFIYDKNGNKLQDINQKGDATIYEYDALNRLVKTTDVLGFASRFAFDANGNRTNIIDAKGNTTSYNYDPLNRLTKQVFPDGTTKRFTYDAASNPLSRADNNGVLTQYKYDKLNRLLSRTYPNNQKDTFQYDAIGRMTAAINANATVVLNYDGVNRLLKENLNGKEISYIYNNSNRKKNITYPSGMQVGWEMDYRDRLSVINESGSLLASFQYDAADRMTTKQYRNNTTTAYNYDNVNNVTGIQVSPNNIMHINYAYDSLDNRIVTERLHQPNFSEQYSYDKLSQLKKFTAGNYQNGIANPTKQHQYNYDGLGNRVTTQEDTDSRIYAVNNLNQYKTIVTNGVNATLNYDANGNTLNDGSNVYTYDYENRSVAVQNSSGTIAYKYDALGRRIARTVNGVETLYYYCQANLIEERTVNTYTNYIYDIGLDKILFSKIGAVEYFYHADALNSVHALSNISGNIVEQYKYDAFGNPSVYNSAGILLTSSLINNLLFNGRWFDYQSKIYNFRNRENNSLIGRFSQRDPLEVIDGLNSYIYVRNNPLNRTDPMGLTDYWGLGGSALGVVGNSIAAFGSGVFAIVTSPTVGGSIIGTAGVGYFGYGAYANYQNFLDAWNDRPLGSTGAALGDLAKAYAPCNETLRDLAFGADLGLGFFGPGAIGSRLGNAATKAGEVVADEGSLILNAVNTANRTGSAGYKSREINNAEHFFSDIVDNYASYATKSPLIGGDGVSRDLYQIQGSLRGQNGVFEWIVEGKNVTHRRFIPDGVVNGIPNQRILK